jgi:hypothetical protein
MKNNLFPLQSINESVNNRQPKSRKRTMYDGVRTERFATNILCSGEIFFRMQLHHNVSHIITMESNTIINRIDISLPLHTARFFTFTDCETSVRRSQFMNINDRQKKMMCSNTFPFPSINESISDRESKVGNEQCAAALGRIGSRRIYPLENGIFAFLIRLYSFRYYDFIGSIIKLTPRLRHLAALPFFRSAFQARNTKRRFGVADYEL